MIIQESLIAQNINIPDASFKRALLSVGVDTNGDGEISKAEAEAVTNLNIAFKRILSPDLRGIEYFINLTHFNCNTNYQLKNIDLSKNTKLKVLNINQTSITSLDLSKNVALEELDCDVTLHLTNLNLSKNLALKKLKCSLSSINEFDLSKNVNLKEFSCYQTKITQLDLSKNSALTYLRCFYNDHLESLNIANGNNVNLRLVAGTRTPKLRCIQVDPNIINNIPSNWTKPVGAGYSTNCYTTVNEHNLSSIEIYPNPVSNKLYIKTNGQDKIDYTYIFDLLGKQIKKTKSQTIIDVKNLVSGIYLLKIEVGGKTICRKIIKK